MKALSPKQLNFSEHTILVITDNINNMAMMTGYLKERGLRVLAATGGQRGLKRARQVKPDLILLDAMMPEMDGFETCRRLKAGPATREIPIIFMIAPADDDHKKKGFEAGAVDFIVKPFQKEETLARISTHLRLRQLTQSRPEPGDHLEHKVQELTRELTEAKRLNEQLQQEIAERAQAEQVLRKSEEKFSKIFYSSPSAMTVTKMADGTIVDANESFAQATGFSREEFVGRTTMELGLWAKPEGRSGYVEAIRDQTEPRNHEIQILDKSGEIRTFLLTGEPIDLNGEPHLLSSSQDITERVRAEEALKKSEARLTLIAEASEDVFFVSTFTEVLYASPAFETIWGRLVPDLYNDGGEWDKGIHPDDLQHVLDAWARMTEQGDRYDETYRVLRPDGSIRWVRDRCYPIHDESGQVYRRAGIAQDITERVQAEQALRESEARFKQLAEAIDDIFVLTDVKNWSALYVSPAYEKILGRPVQDLYEDVGVWDEAVHPEDRLRIQEAWKRMVEQGGIFDEEYRVIRPDGTTRWVRDRWYPVRDESGQVYRVAEVVQDITERVQAEQALRESEARFKQLAEAIDDVFTISDMKNLSVLYASPAYEKIWGRPLRDLYDDYRAWDDSIHPDDRQGILEAWERMKEQGSSYDEEYRVLHPDGSMRWVRDRGFHVRDESGQVYRVAGIAQDITERLQAEQALRESEANLRATLNSIGDAVIAIDTGGDITSMNPVAEQLTGWKFAEAQGKALTEIFQIFNAQTKEPAVNPVRKVLESGKFAGLGNHTVLIAKNGAEYRIADSAAPIQDAEGAITGVVLVFRDVTEEYRVREELQESEARFKQIADAIEDAFIISDVKSWSVLYASPAWEKIWGRPVQALYEDIRHWDEGVHPDDRSHTQEAWLRMVEQGERFDEEYRVIRPDGTMRWVRSEHYPILDESGQVYRVAEVVQDITERVQAEEALKESETRLHEIANVFDDVFQISDLKNMKVLFASPAFEKIWGRSLQDLYDDYRVWDAGIHPDDVKRMQRSVERMLEVGSYEEKYRVIHSDGSMRWVRERLYPVRDESGQAYRMAGIVQDITDQKRAEEELRKSQAHYSQAERMGKMGHWEWDHINYGMVSCSDQLARIFGMTVDETLAFFTSREAELSIVYPDDRERYAQHITEAEEQRKGMDIEYRIYNSSGALRHIHTQSDLVLDDQDRIIKSFGAAQDITGQVRAEEALRESETRFHEIANVIDDVFQISDVRNMKVLFASPAFEKIWGRPVQDLYDDGRVWDEAIHPDDVKRMQGAWERMLEGERYDEEYRVIHPDGSIRWVRSRLYPVRDENGRIYRVAGVAQDITERLRAEEALKEYSERLEEMVEERTQELQDAQDQLVRREKLAALGQLTATVAHEIRNPLGTVRVSVFAIGDAIERNQMGRIARALQLAERNIVRCDAIITELLDYTRDRVLQLTSTDVDPWLEEVLDEQIIPEGIVCIKELSAGVEVPIDQEHLRRAVINVVENAIDALQDEATPGNQLTVGTHVVEDPTGGRSGLRLEIRVSDTGPGIPDDVLAKIFEPLFSTKSFGVGLGLPIVENLMEKHNGGIEIDSKMGQGTTVTLWLPAPNNTGGRLR